MNAVFQTWQNGLASPAIDALIRAWLDVGIPETPEFLASLDRKRFAEILRELADFLECS